jgi:hypothetical protein
VTTTVTLAFCVQIRYSPDMRYRRKVTGLPFQTSHRTRRQKLPLPSVPTSGRPVRSSFEKVCVAFFEEHSLRYQYEPLLLLSGRQFRPDFYLPDLGLFIEICGYVHMPFYRDRMEEKRRVYETQGLRVVFIVPERGKKFREQLTELILGRLPIK